MVFPYVFTYLTVTSTSSVITPSNHEEHMYRYPYDHVIYYPGAFCRTCKHLKPARSKHCRICNVCVARMDHHCPWVMTCLGAENYRWFLLMLLSLGVLLAYGAHLGYDILYAYLQDRFERENPTVRTAWTHGLTVFQKVNAFGWSFVWDTRIGTVAMLAAFTAPLASGLFLYHVYLVWAGVTTNENFKWDDWKEDVRDGYVFVARERRQPVSDGTEPFVRWPKRNDQVLINRAILVSRERFPAEMSIREPDWSRVESMRDIVNVYDLGFARNVKEVLNL